MSLTVKEAEALAFCLESPLRGRPLHKALAARRGIKVPTAEIAVARLYAKGLLRFDGSPAVAVGILREVQSFLASRVWPAQDAEAVMVLRERIAEVLR